MPNPSAAPQSAPEIAYEWVKTFIVGLPRDEDAFLNEVSLAQSTGTSRTPVREALLRLEAEGFIRRVPHKGAYVPAVSDPEVRTLMRARSVVEKWAATADVPELDRRVPELQDLIDRQRAEVDDLRRFIELDIEFHSLMVRTGDNHILSDFYDSLRQRQSRVGVKAVTSGENRAGEVLREHQAILDAVRSHDEAASHAAIDAHLNSTLAAVISF
jgi:DNA-binding GntR family transcriptional regulator